MAVNVTVVEPGYASGDSAPAMPTAAVFVAGPISSPTDVGSLSISGPLYKCCDDHSRKRSWFHVSRYWSNVGEGAPETEPSFSLYVADTNTPNGKREAVASGLHQLT